MAFLLAEVLSCAFHPEQKPDIAALQEIGQKIDSWCIVGRLYLSLCFSNLGVGGFDRAFPEILDVATFSW